MATLSRSKAATRKAKRRAIRFTTAPAPAAQPLLHGVDSGAPLHVPPHVFIVKAGREGGWGTYLDPFVTLNEPALRALNLEPRVVAGRDGARLELMPGLRAGAVPLRSPATGKVAGGVIITPRFGWPGVGQVLRATGWGSGPEFLPFPLVPGSGREVPPWVLAGPVLQRLSDLLQGLRRGYREHEAVRTQPRGQIQWQRYVTQQLPAGKWHQLPCRTSELEYDTRLRQVIRWTLEHLRGDLARTGAHDTLSLWLIERITRLIEHVADVIPRRPTHSEVDGGTGGNAFVSAAVKEGLRAIGWVVDERGLGGGQTSDGLAWSLSLETLWERYVEHIVRGEAARTGGRVRVGRLGETTIPLAWNDPGHRSLGHLVPDIVVQRAGSVEIIDAKYKAHFADLDATRWARFTDEVQASMRADIHQVLAYAAVAPEAQMTRATLFYPVRQTMFEALAARGQDRVVARIPVGIGEVRLEMRAAGFG